MTDEQAEITTTTEIARQVTPPLRLNLQPSKCLHGLADRLHEAWQSADSWSHATQDNGIMINLPRNEHVINLGQLSRQPAPDESAGEHAWSTTTDSAGSTVHSDAPTALPADVATVAQQTPLRMVRRRPYTIDRSDQQEDLMGPKAQAQAEIIFGWPRSTSSTSKPTSRWQRRTWRGSTGSRSNRSGGDPRSSRISRALTTRRAAQHLKRLVRSAKPAQLRTRHQLGQLFDDRLQTNRNRVSRRALPLAP